MHTHMQFVSKTDASGVPQNCACEDSFTAVQFPAGFYPKIPVYKNAQL